MRTPPRGQSGAREAERPAPRPLNTELLYGHNAVREALRAGRRRLRRLYVARGIEQQARVGELIALAGERDVAIQVIERAQLDARVAGHHQGVALDVSPYPYFEGADLAALARERRIVLALDGLADPQNVGTLLRTAEAVGVALVVIPNDRAAGVTPAVVNASSGAVEHLQIAREVNLARWIGHAKAAGFWVAGLAGDADAQPLFDNSLTPPLVVVVGSEGTGLRRLVREACDIVAAIPMVGQVESLNAAIAGSLALYEAFRDAHDE